MSTSGRTLQHLAIEKILRDLSELGRRDWPAGGEVLPAVAMTTQEHWDVDK